MRLLVVEDYDPVRNAVATALREEGYSVDTAKNGEDGVFQASVNDYDAVVLDVMLPKLDGFGVVQRLRKDGRACPILLLTARDGVDDRVHGLDLGADDYLVKPFAMDELLARVRALVRRRYETRTPVLTVGPLEVDTASHAVKLAGERVELTAREYALLEFLVMRTGRLVTRTQIWEHLYDDLTEVKSNVVDVYIGYLRKKIEPDGVPRLIHTKRGEGYIVAETPP
ncbi:MAG: response regulator transcription factor [Planctomycetes bacterium]|nr:response regulator transcription factor [Planctomycetota bacterium]